MRDLRGTTAVVTGGASGIGFALAREVASEGARVVVADIDPQAAEEASDALRSDGWEAYGFEVDVSDPESVDALAETVARAVGEVGLLCANAGIIRAGTAHEHLLEDWRALLAVNVMGVVHSIRSFVPAMLAHGRPGHVLTTASVGGLMAADHFAGYIATKHAVVGLTECLALDLAGTAIGVTVLCPGGVATNIYRTETERRLRSGVDRGSGVERRFEEMASPGRTDQMSPEEVARIALRAVRHGDLHAFAFGAPVAEKVEARLDALRHALDATGGSTT